MNRPDGTAGGEESGNGDDCGKQQEEVKGLEKWEEKSSQHILSQFFDSL